jgi:hypothetical protein
MAGNTQSFFTRQENVKKVDMSNSSSVEKQLSTLTNIVDKLVQNNLTAQVKSCGICLNYGHATDACPALKEDEHVNAVGGFPGQPQRKYNPYSNTYNEGWKDHPNFRWGNQNVKPFSQNNPQSFGQTYNQQQPPQNQSQGMTLEDMVKSLASSSLNFQKETKSSIQNLENQVGQLAKDINNLQVQISNKLPSQPLNPRENVSAITLRSGKELSDITQKSLDFEKELVVDHNKKDEKIDATKDDEKSKNELDDDSTNSRQFKMKENERIKSSSNSSIDATEIRPPFPERLRKFDKRVDII